MGKYALKYKTIAYYHWPKFPHLVRQPLEANILRRGAKPQPELTIMQIVSLLRVDSRTWSRGKEYIFAIKRLAGGRSPPKILNKETKEPK